MSAAVKPRRAYRCERCGAMGRAWHSCCLEPVRGPDDSPDGCPCGECAGIFCDACERADRF